MPAVLPAFPLPQAPIPDPGGLRSYKKKVLTGRSKQVQEHLWSNDNLRETLHLPGTPHYLSDNGGQEGSGWRAVQGGTLNPESFHSSRIPGVGPICREQPWTAQLYPRDPPGRKRAHRSPSGFCKGPGGRSSPRRPIPPQRLRLRGEVQEGPARGRSCRATQRATPPTARPGAAHPPVSAPESTQSSSSPPPVLGSMARPQPRSAHGRGRDPGALPPSSPAQRSLMAVLPAGVSRAGLGQTHSRRPRSPAPRPLLAAPAGPRLPLPPRPASRSAV